jgi:hypothetical protein
VDIQNIGGIGSWFSSNYPSGIGQSVTFGPNPSEVTGYNCRFRDSFAGYPGLVRCAAYADSGDGTPTGPTLAVSDYYAKDSANSSYTQYYFPLSGWTPSASTSYVFLLEFFEYLGGRTGFGLRVTIAGGDPYAGGNASYSARSNATEIEVVGGIAQPTIDLDFTVYSVSGSTTAPDDDSIRFRDAMNRRRYGGLFR